MYFQNGSFESSIFLSMVSTNQYIFVLGPHYHVRVEFCGVKNTDKKKLRLMTEFI